VSTLAAVPAKAGSVIPASLTVTPTSLTVIPASLAVIPANAGIPCLSTPARMISINSRLLPSLRYGGTSRGNDETV
jgi:hypothetical protein